MNKKGFIVTTVILVILIIALVVGVFFIWQDNQKVKEDNQNLNNTINNLEQEVKKSEKTIEELESKEENTDETSKQTSTEELTEEDYVKAAFEKYLKEVSQEEGMELSDYRVDKVKIVNRDEVKDFLEFEVSIPAEITYSVKPASKENYINWTAGNGEEDGEWVKNKSAVCEVALTTKGYAVMNVGTGW